MKRYIYILAALCGSLMLFSCEKTVDSSTWGATEYYKDFLFKKCPPDTLLRTLVVSFNEESEKLPRDSRTLVFSLCKMTDVGEAIRVIPSEAQVFVNGQASEDNTISIKPTGIPDEVQRIKVGIVLNKQFLDSIDEDCMVSYFLKVEKNPGFDRLNDLDICAADSRKATPVLDKSKDSWTPMTLYINVVSNSLKQGVIWGSILSLLLYLIWFLVSRFSIWKRTSFSNVYIDYHDGAGRMPIRMNGAYELVFTGNPRAKDSVLAKIFKGSRKYEYNDFWQHDISMKDGRLRGSVKLSGLRSYYTSTDPERGIEFNIFNESGKKVTIEIS